MDLYGILFGLYHLRAVLLEGIGCEVWEDLSALCEWGTYNVPR